MIVADTSLIAHLAMPTPHTVAAERLLARDPDWVAPLLWRSEFRNVLRRYLRKELIRLEQALVLQAEMESLFEGREYEVVSSDVLSLVNRSGCSAYDCEFVSLAQALGVRLVTMDRRLAGRFPETAVLLTALAT